MIASRKRCRLSPGGPLLLMLITLGAVGDTKAQFVPANAIRIVVPAIAGTPPDVSCRIIANELADSEGWRIVVENKSGSSGVIAATSVFQQPTDGTTILMITQPDSASPSLINNVRLGLDTDFA